mmetsp:Transcript_49189/g.104689  ORF Transcript_49189/g.104689 Transcript_49189/m.104689 type:complete len:101 (-) Transcript_49189:24-326(-)
MKAPKLIQKAPYDVNADAPNVFPAANSHIPAAHWAVPPKNKPWARTRFKSVFSLMPAFSKFNKIVVTPKANNPSGAGFAYVDTLEQCVCVICFKGDQNNE